MNSFNADGYVRIPIVELPNVQLQHVASELDPTIAVNIGPQPAITGFTEWAGSWKTSAISLGWDWGVVNGLIVVINPQEIRTNLLLLDQSDRAEPKDRARIHLLEWIESIPWRDTAVEKLVRDK